MKNRMRLRALEFLLKWKFKIAEARLSPNILRVSNFKEEEMVQKLRSTITESSFKGFMKMISERDQENSSLKAGEDTKDFLRREDLKEWEFM